MSLMSTILGRRQSVEDSARARYRALIIRGAGEDKTLTDREIGELDSLAARFGYSAEDLGKQLEAVAEAARLRPVVATMAEAQDDRYAAGREFQEVGEKKAAAIAKFTVELTAIERRQNKAMSRAMAARDANTALEQLTRDFGWLVGSEATK